MGLNRYGRFNKTTVKPLFFCLLFIPTILYAESIYKINYTPGMTWGGTFDEYQSLNEVEQAMQSYLTLYHQQNSANFYPRSIDFYGVEIEKISENEEYRYYYYIPILAQKTVWYGRSWSTVRIHTNSGTQACDDVFSRAQYYEPITASVEFITESDPLLGSCVITFADTITNSQWESRISIKRIYGCPAYMVPKRIVERDGTPSTITWSKNHKALSSGGNIFSLAVNESDPASASDVCVTGRPVARVYVKNEEKQCKHEIYADVQKILPNDPETLKLTLELEKTKGDAGYELLSSSTKIAEHWLRKKFFLTMGYGVEGEYNGQGNELYDRNNKLIYKLTSSFRTEAYQKHIREVWKKSEILENLTDQEQIDACRELKEKVKDHLEYHELTDEPSFDSKHAKNTAFDLSRGSVRRMIKHVGSKSNVALFLEAPYPIPGLGWGGYFTYPKPDIVHFYLKDEQ